MQVKIRQISGLQDIIDTPVSMGVAYSQSFNILSPSTGDNFETGVSMDFTPFTDSVINLYLNGLLEEGSYVDKLGAFYFSNDGGVTVKSVANLESGDKLYWNGLIKGYQLGPQDFITISYEKEYLSYGSVSEQISGISLLDLGDTTSSTTTIDLSVADNQKIRITEDTKLNFINYLEGKEYTIIPYINQEINPTVTYSSNVIFDGNLTKSIVVGGRKDSSFVDGTGFNSSVYSIVLQSDGKMLVGGYFTTYQGVSSPYIIRLNVDGSIDTSFDVGTGFNSGVNSIVLQSDGKILVGGIFNTYQGVSSPYIIRLNSDGSIDGTFVVGFNNTVNSIVLQSDGKILVGGSFFTYQGVTSSPYIIRLNSDGSIDTSFVVGTGFNNIVKSIVLQSDGKILVGGQFTTYQGVSSPYIIRLNPDGSKDTTFVVGSGFNSTINSIVLQSDGKILVGGNFTTYKVISSPYIIRLNSDGSKDITFVINIGFSSFVNSIVLQSDGKILVGGNFTKYQGISSPYIIRLNSDGSKDPIFVTSTVFGSVQSILVQSDDKILVGGGFTKYYGVISNSVIRLNTIPNIIYYKLSLVSDGTNLFIKF